MIKTERNPKKLKNEIEKLKNYRFVKEILFQLFLTTNYINKLYRPMITLLQELTFRVTLKLVWFVKPFQVQLSGRWSCEKENSANQLAGPIKRSFDVTGWLSIKATGSTLPKSDLGGGVAKWVRRVLTRRTRLTSPAAGVNSGSDRRLCELNINEATPVALEDLWLLVLIAWLSTQHPNEATLFPIFLLNNTISQWIARIKISIPVGKNGPVGWPSRIRYSSELKFEKEKLWRTGKPWKHQDFG